MILAEAAEQTSSFAAQAFFYVAIAIAVGYFGWQFYKGAKQEGPLNTGWLSGPKKKSDVPAADGTETADESAQDDAAVDEASAEETSTEQGDAER